MPVVNTKGAASSQGFGEFAKSGAAAYIEDVFSTYLYTGTGASQTITNNIDLSTKGGMVWQKSRSAAGQNFIFDTARGALQYLSSNSTNASANYNESLTAFNANGFNLGFNLSNSGETDVTWTFRKQAKFFDVVTWTGTGATRTINHNLGSVPGCIIIKCTSNVEDWFVYHSSLGNTGTNQYFCILNSSAAQDTGGYGVEKASNWTSTQFGINGSPVNVSGRTYVAYIYASNAGGFGLAGTDNVISCGSFTANASGNATVNLGYEPQFILYKSSTAVGVWAIFDTMRGWSYTLNNYLQPNSSAAELSVSGGPYRYPTATGCTFVGSLAASETYIYIAIRRGPMRTPTTGTSVFTPLAYTGDNTQPRLLNFGITLDAAIFRKRNSAVDAENPFGARLLGSNTMNTTDTSVETPILISDWASNVGVSVKSDGKINGTSSFTYISTGLKRAPGFFDVVCYTGTGANATWTHNLGVAPEMMLVKKRSAAANWAVYHSALTAAGYAILNTTAASSTASTFWQSTAPTSTSFYTGTNGNVGDSGATYVAYLFATCPGVSKVFSYTGNGTSQTINCGFTGGARFILIKRTDTTGDWYVWDTARGIVAGTDPHLSLNTTVAEVTTDDSIDPDSTGFIVNQLAATNINVSAATYIGLAIA